VAEPPERREDKGKRQFFKTGALCGVEKQQKKGKSPERFLVKHTKRQGLAKTTCKQKMIELGGKIERKGGGP